MDDHAPPSKPLPVAVLLSGGGRTLANLLAHIERGAVNASVRVVIGSRGRLGGAAVAGEAGVPYAVIPRKQFADADAHSDAIWDFLVPYSVQLVVLAGWLHRLRVPPAWTGRVLNIHPSLLPAFGGQGMYGRHVHAAVLAHGCKVSGCTVHLADDTYDTGPIVAQCCVPVQDDDTPDTLAARVFAAECALYPQVIAAFAAGRVQIAGRRVTLLPGNDAVPDERG